MSNALMYCCACSVPETGNKKKPFVELWRLKELYKTFRAKHLAKQETRKALRDAVVVLVFCLLVLEKR